MTLESFIKEVAADPWLLAAALPCMAMMLINGWTDAPVSIATAVNSGAVTLRKAAVLAAVFNMLGAATVAVFGNAVAVSVMEISGFSEVSGDKASAGFTAAMLSVAVWSLIALYFGIPTSESHALMAGLVGASIAVCGVGAVDLAEWLKVIFGLIVSTLPVIFLSKKVSYIFLKFSEKRKISENGLKKLQVAGAALSSFAHGAQDGQKFAGIFTVQTALCLRLGGEVSVPVWTVVLGAVMISIGMLLGGRRIIDSFSEFAPKDPAGGVCADAVSSAVLLLLSFTGIPVSTTSAKTCATLGVGGKRGLQMLKTALPLLLAWVLTFPVCAVLGYMITMLLFRFL